MVFMNKNTILDLTPQLRRLEEQISSWAYEAQISVKIFEYLPNSEFSSCDAGFITEIYANEIAEATKIWGAGASVCRDVKGFFRERPYASVNESISTFFSYFADPLLVNERTNSTEHKLYTQVFWNVIMPHFSFPPTKCLEFCPDDDSYLHAFAGWSCSALLIDERAKKCLFLWLNGIM